MKIFLSIGIFMCFASCSPARWIGHSSKKMLLNDPALRSAHVGISIFEPVSGKTWYDYQGSRYFVPASNIKIPTCYAAMKYLGDSLSGLKVVEYENTIVGSATADPTFLHEDFKIQQVVAFLKNSKKDIYLDAAHWNDNAWGSGWSWSDYDADYLAERSPFPVYGNVATFSGRSDSIMVTPFRFEALIQVKDSSKGYLSKVSREWVHNVFTAFTYGKAPKKIQVPFITSGDLYSQLLEDTIHHPIHFMTPGSPPAVNLKDASRTYVIHSQPTDSVLKPMMHRSDNFFAEQILLMVSNESLGTMSDASIIDTLLKTEFKDLPQKPNWVDGSGLSRYNLFTPQDMVMLLNKIRLEFGMDRVKIIFPTGNEGTLTNYYKSDSTFIFAKTGTLSGVVALSGYLYTKKNKLLVFSILVNNHQSSAASVRRAIEKLIHSVRKRF